MADSEQALQDKMAIPRVGRAFGVDSLITPPLTGDEEGEGPLNDAQHSSQPLFYSTWDALASTGNLVDRVDWVPTNDGCVHALSSSIDAVGSSLTPQSIIEALYNTTEGLQKQEDISLKYIDPRLLSTSLPEEVTPIETPRAFTLDTHSNLGIFPSPTSAPVAAAHRDGNYANVTSTSHQLLPPLSQAPAQRAHLRPSRRRNDHARTHNLSPRHKKRRAKALETLDQQPFYHALPTADREYFHQVVTNLRNSPYLVSPQSLEPTVGSRDGSRLIGPLRPGVAAAARESVYVVLLDRSSEGAYVCWICGEVRPDRRLVRALDHVRAHFNHHPYHCSESHFNQSTGPTSSLPLVSVCGQSFTCAEALKDHQTKTKNKGHACETCGKIYANSANLKRHERKEHSS